MANYKAGDVIRMTRKSIGMSQETLCDGICSVETLSRIENGKHRVKKETYEHLMARMERTTGKNYAICTSDDMELLEERTHLEDALTKYDYSEAERYLNLLKEKVSDNILNKQFIKNTEAVLNHYNGKISTEELKKEIEDAIKLTVPEYEKHLDGIYPYTEQELLMLLRLANAYLKSKCYEKCIQIYKMILRCLEDEYIDGENIIQFKIIVLRNYAHLLTETKNYEESIDRLQEVLKLSILNDYGRMIPIAMYSITINQIKLYENGNHSIKLEEVKEMRKKAYYIAKARNDNNVKEIIKESYENYFDDKIDDI